MNLPDPEGLTDRDYEALARFRRGLRQFLAFSESAAHAQGLTPSQHQLLLAIRGSRAPVGDAGPEQAPAAPSVSDLADALHRRRNSTTELIDRAEEQGLVYTEPDPADRRRRLVFLTAVGRAHIARLSELHKRELQNFRADFTQILDELS